MDAASAQKLITDTGLIEGPLSRAVLSAIVHDRLVLDNVPAPLRQDVAHIAAKYHRLRQTGAEPCRNLPFYRMIKDHYPAFKWELLPGGVKIDYTYKGIKPSLLSFLLGRVPEPPEEHDPMEALPVAVREAVDRLCYEINLVPPTAHQRALFTEPLTIVSPVCPDYSTEPIAPTSDENGYAAKRHRFTFESIGSDLGVTAIHLLEFLPQLHERLKSLGCAFTHWICPGDFEGFSAETCARLDVSEAAFLEQIARQVDAIRASAPSNIEVCAFSDFCEGKPGWSDRCAAVEARMASGDLVHLKDEEWVKQTAIGRKALYDRWYPREAADASLYVDIVLRQGVEYAAMGDIIWTNPKLKNPLVLGADDHKMGQFYHALAPVPVIYLERRYE
jgi:hypothetical protein